MCFSHLQNTSSGNDLNSSTWQDSMITALKHCACISISYF